MAEEDSAPEVDLNQVARIVSSYVRDVVARIGWSAGATPQKSMSDAPTAID